MSDQSNGRGWWQGTDGKWYPPDQHPMNRPPETPAAPQPPPSPAFAPPVLPHALPVLPSHERAVAPSEPTYHGPPRRSRHVRRVLVAGGLLIVLGIVAALVRSGDDGVPIPGGDSVLGEANPLDGSGDISSCVLVDSGSMQLDVTNTSSERSSYMVEVDVLDPNGTRIGDETVFINHLRPGERSIEDSPIFDTTGGQTCVIARVVRLQSPPSDDLTGVDCLLVEEDPAGTVSVRLTVSNRAPMMASFTVAVALVRDGVRVGTTIASIQDVGPDESGSFVTGITVSDPAASLACEVAYVERLASE